MRTELEVRNEIDVLTKFMQNAEATWSQLADQIAEYGATTSSPSEKEEARAWHNEEYGKYNRLMITGIAKMVQLDNELTDIRIAQVNSLR